MCRLRMTKFRVKMDMSQFYDDERNLAYILVDPKWEQVLCLQEHVEKLFDVSNVHFLTEDGVFIPPKESIDIIRSNDVLRAIIPQKMKRKKIKINLSGYDGFGDEVVAQEGKVEKLPKREDEERVSCSTPNQRSATKKQKVSVELMQLKIHENPEGYNVYTHADVAASKGQQYNVLNETVSSTNSSSTGAMIEQMSESLQLNDETAKSRKRKRNRKKKTERDNSVRLSSVPIPISSSMLRLSKELNITNKQSPKHVHFDESATLVEEDSESKDHRVVFRCRLNTDGTLPARDIEAEEMYDGAPPSKKPKIQIHENVVIVRGNDSTEEPYDYSVIDLDDSELKPEMEENENNEYDGDDHAKEIPKVSVDEILPLSVPMSGLPSAGDVVLFKMYKLTDMCSPGVTEYICGRCEEVDAVKRSMSCIVLDGHDQIEETNLKFTGDGVVKNNEANLVVFFLDELLDKRVFSMS